MLSPFSTTVSFGGGGGVSMSTTAVLFAIVCFPEENSDVYRTDQLLSNNKNGNSSFMFTHTLSDANSLWAQQHDWPTPLTSESQQEPLHCTEQPAGTQVPAE